MKVAKNTRYGGPDALTIAEVPRPVIAPKQVLVAVRASAVTQGDRRLRAADYPGFSAVFGRLLTGVFAPRQSVGGTMFSGRVAEVGAETSRFSVGDDVYGSVMHGAYGEYIALNDSDALALMPRGLDYSEAAALPYGAVTALVFLRDLAKLQPGEHVLVKGSSGGVGYLAVQMAVALGAKVTAVGGDNASAGALGASEVIDYRTEDFATNGKRYDVILDTVEGGAFQRYRGSLTKRGRYLSLYATARLLFEMGYTAFSGGQRALTGVAMGNAKLLEQVRDFVERDALKPIVARRFPFQDVVEAHRFLESGKPVGGVVIDVPAASGESPMESFSESAFSSLSAHATQGGSC